MVSDEEVAKPRRAAASRANTKPVIKQNKRKAIAVSDSESSDNGEAFTIRKTPASTAASKQIKAVKAVVDRQSDKPRSILKKSSKYEEAQRAKADEKEAEAHRRPTKQRGTLWIMLALRSLSFQLTMFL